MFSSNRSLPREKSEYPKSSIENKNKNQINPAVDASEELNQNEINITNIVHPNCNIPKTVYYKRLCQKLTSQNETIKCNNMTSGQIENSSTNISNKIKLDGNDSNILKEIATPLIHNDSIKNHCSKLVICKSDVIPNDCTFDNTPNVQCEKPENGKENTSSPSFFAKLKSPSKFKRKMVISPATIGVQNLPNIAQKNVEKVNERKSINSGIQCTTNNSPQNKTIDTSLKDTQPKLINRHKDTMIDSKTNDKILPTMDRVLDQHLPISVNNDQILPMDIETAPVSLKNKVTTGKMDNFVAVTKLKESSPITCKQLSINNEFNNSFECVESPTENKNKSLRKLSSSNTCKQLSNNSEYDKSMRCEKSSIKNENKSLVKVSLPISSKHLTDYECDKSIKHVKSHHNEKKSSSSSQLSNNQLEHKLSVIKDVCNPTKLIESNDSIKSQTKNILCETSSDNKTSINIEVEQIPFKTRTVKILKDCNTLPPTKMRECSRVSCKNSSDNNEFNMSNKCIENVTMCNENELISSEQKKNQPEHKLPALNHKSDSAEFTELNSSLKSKSEETSLANNTSINIEVEQGSIFRRSNSRKVITHSSFEHNKIETKKGRRVQLITIKDHCSQPLPSFNGAKKKEIDVSKNSIHIEKVVESSSLFYIPQVKRRRTINFSNAES